MGSSRLRPAPSPGAYQILVICSRSRGVLTYSAPELSIAAARNHRAIRVRTKQFLNSTQCLDKLLAIPGVQSVLGGFLHGKNEYIAAPLQGEIAKCRNLSHLVDFINRSSSVASDNFQAEQLFLIRTLDMFTDELEFPAFWISRTRRIVCCRNSPIADCRGPHRLYRFILA